MKKSTLFTLAVFLSAAFISGAAITTSGQTPSLQATTRQVRTLASRIGRETTTFKQLMQRAVNRSNGNYSGGDDRIMEMIGAFEGSVRLFTSNSNSGRFGENDLSGLLNNATSINAFMLRNPMQGRTGSQWVLIKNDVYTLARYYQVSWNPNENVRLPENSVYFTTDDQMRGLIAQIESKTNTFKGQLIRSLDNSNYNNTNREDSINAYVHDFENATDHLKENFNARRSTVADATEVLNRGNYIDRFMTSNRLDRSTESQWVSIKTDLNTLATYYRVSWDWSRTVTPPIYAVYTSTDDQLRNLIDSIETKTNNFKREMNTTLDESKLNNTNREDSVNAYVRDFENATDRLKENFDNRRSTVADAWKVLTRGRNIDTFMSRNRLNRTAQVQWQYLRNDLDTLATYYRVSWNWNERNPIDQGGTFPTGRLENRLTGTFRLNTSQSDNVENVVNKSLGVYSNDQRDRVSQNLSRRLRSPEMIAIDTSGRTVNLASSNVPQVTFEADGVGRTETNDRGKTVTTTATLNNNGLLINYEGDRMNDFYVTFAPGTNGQLNVTRRIYLENRNETITVSSVYDRVSNDAQWQSVNSGTAYPVDNGGTGSFFIPNGTRLTATMQSTVSTKASQVGDRFTMQVTSPSQFYGAVLGGRVSQADNSGRVSGRANISLDFDTVTMNGRTYRFAGIIDSATAANGDSITVNNEGQVRDSNQTTKTVTRAGIGAIIGAIIGAVADGGQGAAIGAGVGAGAGAGSVLITGRDSIELGPGSTFNVTSGGPANVGANRN